MRVVNRYLWATVVAAGTSSFGFASIVSAATAPVADTATLEEIIVTATRREESLQDVPMAMDVATGETLQKLAIFDAKDIQQLSPGLELTNTNGRNNAATLRGINFDPDQGTSPSVDLYFNEINVDAQTAFTAIFDLQQIEVLRGPQGLLRGRTAPGGAITFTSRKADLYKFTGYGEATVTDRNAYNMQGALSVPLVEGVLAVRIAGLGDSNRINQVYNVNRGEYSRSRTQGGRLSLSYKPSDDFNLKFMYQYLHVDNHQNQQVIGPGNAPAANPIGAVGPLPGSPELSGPPADKNDYIAVAEGERRERNNGSLITLNADWNTGPVTLSFIAGHQYAVLNNQVDNDSANAVPGYTNIQSTRVPVKVDNLEFRVVSNNEGFWNWTLSGTYSKQTGDVTVNQGATAFFGNYPYSYGVFLPGTADILIPVSSNTWTVAASSRFEFTDALTLELGARYNNVHGKQTATLIYASPGYALFGIPPSLSQSSLIPASLSETKVHPITGGATLSYKITPDVNTYLAYGHSYRGPTAGVSIPVGVTPDLVKSKEEKSDALELGVKTTFAERFTLSADVFYQKFDNYITRLLSIFRVAPQDPTPTGTFDVNYNGDATVKGVEVTLAGKPVENWDFQLSGSYAKARWKNATLPCNTNTFDSTGNQTLLATSGNVDYCTTSDRISSLPDWSVTGNTEVRFPIGPVTPFVSALVNYRPSVSYWVDNYKYDARTLINLFAGVRGGTESRWEAKVFARNVLNEKKITHINPYPGYILQGTAVSAAPYNSGYHLVNVTNPREFGFTVSYDF